MSSSTYRTVLRAPGAAAFFTTAAVGRVGIAMTSLGLVWLVHARTGSYATAGVVTGGFAVAEAAVGPQAARLVDRLGQTRVLPPLLLAHAAAVVALLGMVTAGGPVWSLTVGGVLAGATIPQLGALSAARWSSLLRGDAAGALLTAFSLESLSNGTAYLAGPVLVSAVAATGHPALGTLLAVAMSKIANDDPRGRSVGEEELRLLAVDWPWPRNTAPPLRRPARAVPTGTAPGDPCSGAPSSSWSASTWASAPTSGRSRSR